MAEPGKLADVDEATLRHLVYDEGLSDEAIATLYGVKRQSVAYRKKKFGIMSERQAKLQNNFNHHSPQGFLPWTLHADDQQDGITRALRTLNYLDAPYYPKEVRADSISVALRLREFVLEENRVIRYVKDRNVYNEDGVLISGFTLLPRDPAIDKSGDIIRRPQPANVTPIPETIHNPFAEDAKRRRAQRATEPRRATTA
jgi:hypothetical protein